MQKGHNGFTLIELLVVIAIIGILSSVVLASLNSARTKSRNATLMADVESLSQQAVVYEDQANSYGISSNDCTAGMYGDSRIQTIFGAMALLNNGGTKACYANDTTYGFATILATSTTYTPPTAYWCADSTGKKCGVNDFVALASSGQCGCP